MAPRPLVNADVDDAKRLVAFLDAHGFPVKAAFWLYESDVERWRFIVSLSEARPSGGDLDYEIAKAIHDHEAYDDLLRLDRVSFVETDRPIVRSLAKRFRGRPPEGQHLVDEVVDGDMFVEEALILRLPA